MRRQVQRPARRLERGRRRTGPRSARTRATAGRPNASRPSHRPSTPRTTAGSGRASGRAARAPPRRAGPVVPAPNVASPLVSSSARSPASRAEVHRHERAVRRPRRHAADDARPAAVRDEPRPSPLAEREERPDRLGVGRAGDRVRDRAQPAGAQRHPIRAGSGRGRVGRASRGSSSRADRRPGATPGPWRRPRRASRPVGPSRARSATSGGRGRVAGAVVSIAVLAPPVPAPHRHLRRVSCARPPDPRLMLDLARGPPPRPSDAFRRHQRALVRGVGLHPAARGPRPAPPAACPPAAAGRARA